MKAVYFQPLFDEQKCSYRFSYCLSEELKEQNIVLDRPDYRGMGDSDENFSDVTLDTLRQDLDSLITKQASILIGLRWGASLICDYLYRNRPADHRVILIEPIIDGKKYVNYLLRKQRLKDHMSKTPADLYHDDEYINIEGYKTKRHLLEEIKSFDMTRIPDDNQVCLLFNRSRLPNIINQLVKNPTKNNQIEIVHVQFPDIWERIPTLDYSPLIDPIVNWCNER